MSYPDHDVLTLEGWKSIDAVTKYDKVAQWDQETNQIEFVHPAVFSKPFDGDLIQFSNHCGTLESTDYTWAQNGTGSHTKVQR